MKFQESKVAHKYLDELKGLEIGGSAHNPFGLDTLNVDFTDEVTVFKQAEIDMCGEFLKVDIVADAIKLPFKTKSKDFVISSHQIEHCFNLIKTIREYKRVIKSGGYILLIAPLPEVCPDDKVQSFNEFKFRDKIKANNNGDGGHCSVCTLITIKEVFEHLNLEIVEALDKDDKVGNGWLIVGRKQ